MISLPLYNPVYIAMHKDFEGAIIAQGYVNGKYQHPIAVREFLFFLEAHKVNDIRKVRTENIMAFHDYLKRRPNINKEGTLSGSYVCGKMGYVRDFFDYLLKTEQIKKLPCDMPKFSFSPKRERTGLSEAEIKIIYDAAKDKTDRAILSCAYGCGMRSGELSRLDISDVLFGKRQIVIRSSKNNKSRIIPIAEGLVKDLKNYLYEERLKKEVHGVYSDAFFLNNFGERTATGTFNKRVRNMIMQTGNRELIEKQPSIHWLRHSITIHLADRGAEPTFIRDFLGHVFLDTTLNIYGKSRKKKVKLYEVNRHPPEGPDIKPVDNLKLPKKALRNTSK